MSERKRHHNFTTWEDRVYDLLKTMPKDNGKGCSMIQSEYYYFMDHVMDLISIVEEYRQYDSFLAAHGMFEEEND